MTKQNRQSIIERYCHQVKKQLPFSLRRRLLDTLQSDLEEYLAQNPNATQEQIEQQFGKPEQFAKALLDALSGPEHTKVRRMQRLAILAMVLAIAVGLFFSSVAIYIAIESRPQPTYYSEEITYL